MGGLDLITFLLAIIAIILLVAFFPRVAEALATVVVYALVPVLILAFIAVAIGLPVAYPHEWWAWIPAAIIVFGVYGAIEDWVIGRRVRRLQRERMLSKSPRKC